MVDKDAIIEAIQAVADATDQPNLRIAYGAPGAHIKDSTGETRPTGLAWEPSPTAWRVIIEGVAAYLDKIRRVLSNDDLQAGDRIIELAVNGITLTLPSASAAYKNRYVIKAMNVPSVSVAGTIDGVAGPHALTAYQVMRVYCTGSEWVTW
jgi:hypothetical protein